MRVTVVPTATTRRPSARAALTASAVAALTTARSDGSVWLSIAGAVMGRNVAGPTWSVSAWISTPAARSRSSSASEKCRPAVGAATDPGVRAYTV